MTKIYTSFLTILFLFGCIHSSIAQQVQYSRVKIDISKNRLGELHQMGCEFDHGAYQDDGYITTLSENDLLLLANTDFDYEVLIEDELAHFLRLNKDANFYEFADDPVERSLHFDSPCTNTMDNFSTPTAFTSGSMGGYYTLAEMNQKIDDLITMYPNIVSNKTTIGTSIEGRPIYAIKISDNPNTDEAEGEALYTSLHHAREPNSMMQIIFFMQYLTENYGSDTRITDLVNAREMWFIPCVNPDGYEYNFQTNPNGGGFHRKNRRETNSTNMGVDLNRNYAYGWGYDNTGSSPNENSDVYRGSGPFSEPETSAVRTFTNSREFQTALHYHSYGNLLIRPWSVPNAPAFTAFEFAMYEKLGAIGTHQNCYEFGDDDQTVGYSTNGVSDDWFFGGDLGLRDPIYSLTPEAGASSDGFWPPSNRIIPIAKENVYTNLQTAYLAGSYYEIEDWSSPEISSASGSFSFHLTRLGLGAAPVTVTLVPISGIAAVGGPIIINSLSNPLDKTTGSISYTLNSNIDVQDGVSFIWRIESAGLTYELPVSKIYQPIIMFSDDMEGSFAANWNTTADWDYGTEEAFGGAQSLTDSPNANYTSNGTRTLYLNNALDLSDATEAYLSFWVKHASQPCHDFLQVELSTTGAGSGATDYAAICGSLSITEDYEDLDNNPAMTGERLEWTREIIPLTDYLGQSNVGLRFRLYLDGNTLEDGFYLDNVEIIKRTTMEELPIELGNFTASVNAEKEVDLNWSTLTESNTRQFTIQRSKTGQDFESLGTRSAAGNSSIRIDYAYTDEAPYPGTSYYRLKLENIDGTVEYSRLLSVNLKGSLVFEVYPNPVRDQFFISTSHIFDEAIIRIHNLMGQEIYQEVLVYNNEQLYGINKPAALQSGTYVIMLDVDGIATQRLFTVE